MIATEVNGETAFVLEAESGDHDVQVKFFTPRHEVPFVGHATIAAQYVRAKKDGKPTGRLRQRTGAGVVEIEVTEIDGDLRVAITQSPPSLGPVIPEHHRRQVLNALGISSPSLHVDCPLQVLTKGGSRLLVGLSSNELLGSIKPDFDELARLTSHVGAEGYFVFAITDNNGQPGTESRMFVPALGIREDAVSGNANPLKHGSQDFLRGSGKSHHRAVVVHITVHIQDMHCPTVVYSRHNRLNGVRIASLTEIWHTFNQRSH